MSSTKYKKILFLAIPLLVTVGIFLSGHYAYALVEEWATKLFTGILSILIWALGLILVLVIQGLVFIASYQEFIGAQAVVLGWVIVRDICNMFFVVILMIIAFGTILHLENYNYKKWLPKLILMAVLINFSKTICGLLIDVAQVVMLTFVNAFKDVGGANLTDMLGISRIVTMANTGDSSFTTIVGAYVLGIIYLLVAIVVIVTMMAMLAMRLVMIWIYVVLSPAAYLLAAFPGGQKYASQWWSEFTKNLIVGPVLAFFLWLSLASLSGANNFVKDNNVAGLTGNGSADATVIQNSAGSSLGTGAKNDIGTQASSPSALIGFVIGIGMLIGGLKIASEIGGAAGSMAGKGMAKLQKGASLTGAYALGRAKATGAAVGRTARNTSLGIASATTRGVGNLINKVSGPGGNKVGNALRDVGGIGIAWRSDMISKTKKAKYDKRQKFLEKMGMGEKTMGATSDFLKTDAGKEMSTAFHGGAIGGAIGAGLGGGVVGGGIGFVAGGLASWVAGKFGKNSGKKSKEAEARSTAHEAMAAQYEAKEAEARSTAPEAMAAQHEARDKHNNKATEYEANAVGHNTNATEHEANATKYDKEAANLRSQGRINGSSGANAAQEEADKEREKAKEEKDLANEATAKSKEHKAMAAQYEADIPKHEARAAEHDAKATEHEANATKYDKEAADLRSQGRLDGPSGANAAQEEADKEREKAKEERALAKDERKTPEEFKKKAEEERKMAKKSSRASKIWSWAGKTFSTAQAFTSETTQTAAAQGSKEITNAKNIVKNAAKNAGDLISDSASQTFYSNSGGQAKKTIEQLGSNDNPDAKQARSNLESHINGIASGAIGKNPAALDTLAGLAKGIAAAKKGGADVSNFSGIIAALDRIKGDVGDAHGLKGADFNSLNDRVVAYRKTGQIGEKGSGELAVNTLANNKQNIDGKNIVGVNFSKLKAQGVDINEEAEGANVSGAQKVQIASALIQEINTEQSNLQTAKNNGEIDDKTFNSRNSDLNKAKERLSQPEAMEGISLVNTASKNYGRQEKMTSVYHEEIHKGGVEDEELTEGLAKSLMSNQLYGRNSKTKGRHATEIAGLAKAMKEKGMSNEDTLKEIDKEIKSRVNAEGHNAAARVLSKESGQKETESAALEGASQPGKKAAEKISPEINTEELQKNIDELSKKFKDFELKSPGLLKSVGAKSGSLDSMVTRSLLKKIALGNDRIARKLSTPLEADVLVQADGKSNETLKP